MTRGQMEMDSVAMLDIGDFHERSSMSDHVPLFLYLHMPGPHEAEGETPSENREITE